MISREEAIKLVLEHPPSLVGEEIPLKNSLNRVTAEDIISPVDHPIFDQSAMDGYCFSHESFRNSLTLELCGEVAAGSKAQIEVGEGQCARIFTGAQIPPGCDTVCMQEQTKVEGKRITFTNKGLQPGMNVRYAGEQLKKGDLALKGGMQLNAAAIGFFASLGIERVTVSRQPKVQIICTGDEFAESESDLSFGKIYESNGQMLVACLEKLGISASYETCIDKLDKLTELIAIRSKEADLLLITGGVSVGDYDFTVPALEGNGFETVFHMVAQKPGKPLLFSKSDTCAAFGLPGNPRAVLICFQHYVRAYIMQSMGIENAELSSVLLPIADSYKKKNDKRTHFLAAVIRNGRVSLRAVQGSHMLGSMAAAEGLVVIPPEERMYEEGDQVEFQFID